MGLVQLPKLAPFVERRRENAAWFRRELAQYGDEFTAGEHGGMDNPFESREEATAGSTKQFHSRGDGVPKE